MWRMTKVSRRVLSAQGSYNPNDALAVRQYIHQASVSLFCSSGRLRSHGHGPLHVCLPHSLRPVAPRLRCPMRSLFGFSVRTLKVPQ